MFVYIVFRHGDSPFASRPINEFQSWINEKPDKKPPLDLYSMVSNKESR